MAVDSVLPTILEFYDSVYKCTEYEDKRDAEAVWSKMRVDLPGVAKGVDGAKLVTKFQMLARTVSAEGPLRDMVKIIWRMVKPMSGTPEHKLCLFFTAVGTVLSYLKTSPLASQTKAWLEKIEYWLGKQLTIGGKGVTGEGEGSVHDRIQRFFSTPYLHDFD